MRIPGCPEGKQVIRLSDALNGPPDGSWMFAELEPIPCANPGQDPGEPSDAEMLDWLEANMPISAIRYRGYREGKYIGDVTECGGPPSDTLRGAISAAMKGKP